MTRNQIEFWKLVYNNKYREVELSIDAYKASLDADKLKLDWAKLSEQIRATIVAEALNERKQTLAEYQATVDVAYTSAQAAKLIADTNRIRQEMVLNIIEGRNKSYETYTKQLIELYGKTVNISFDTRRGLGAQISLFIEQMLTEMQNLEYKRDQVDRAYKNMLQIAQEDFGQYDMPKSITTTNVSNINEAILNLKNWVKNRDSDDDTEDKDVHFSNGQPIVNDKTSNQTIGPGINLSDKSNSSMRKESSSRNTKAPVARESTGPGTNISNSPSGTKIINSNNLGPGIGTRSTPSSGQASKVIYSPGVKSIGPGQF